MSERNDGPREWSLPLNTLIVNSDFERAGGVHVIEKSAFDQLAKERDELKGILNLKQDEYVRQVGEWKIIQRLEEERDSLRAEVERLKSKYDMQELVKRADKYKAALQEIAVEYTIKDYAEMQRPVLTRDLRDIARKVLEETT